jgi:hypothetical protein
MVLTTYIDSIIKTLIAKMDLMGKFKKFSLRKACSVKRPLSWRKNCI